MSRFNKISVFRSGVYRLVMWPLGRLSQALQEIDIMAKETPLLLDTQ